MEENTKCAYFHVWDYFEFAMPEPIKELPQDFKGKELKVFHSWDNFVAWVDSRDFFIGYVQVNF